jgi:sugar lactone lactonase YvrE
MGRRLAALATAIGLVVAFTLPGQASATDRGGGSPGARPVVPRVVATFPASPEAQAFAESMALDRDGNLFATLTTWKAETWNQGQVWKISPNGKMKQVGPNLDVGILSGLAFDANGNLYAGLITFDTDNVPSGVLRIDRNGQATRVVTLPPGSFPNGLAVRGDDLYISDSSHGAIWRAHLRRNAVATLTGPWLADPLLAVASPEGWEGVNGIAFWGDALLAVNADTGSVIRIPLRHDGSPGIPSVVVTDPALIGSDGIAFDADGSLWIAVNHADMAVGGALVRVSRAARVQVVASDPGWLDYPTQPVFGGWGRDRSTLYVVNGSFNTGNCNVIALDAGVRGQPLP